MVAVNVTGFDANAGFAEEVSTFVGVAWVTVRVPFTLVTV
jgi:hypothetical protein